MSSFELPLKELKTLKGHQGSVLAIKWNHEGKYCLSGGNDRSLRLWNPFNGNLIKTYTGHGWEVLDLDVSTDNSRVASCGGDKMVFYWDVNTGRVLRKFRGHESRVNCIKFNQDCSILVTGSYDKTVKIWDCRSNSIDAVQVMGDAKDSVTCLDVGNIEIVVGSVDGHVRRYDIRSGHLFTDTLGHPVTSVKLSHDQNCILASVLKNSLHLIDKMEGDLLGEYKGHKNESYKIDGSFSFDDAYVISGSEDNNIYIWDLVDAKIMAKLQGHTHGVCGISSHPNSSYLLSSSVDGSIKLWGK